MRTQDYKDAAKKLNAFVRECRIKRDFMWYYYYEDMDFIERMNKYWKELLTKTITHECTIAQKTGRNEICPCQPTEKRTITTIDGKPITFSAYKKGGRKFKNCHGRPPLTRKYVYVNTNAELNQQRNSGRIGMMGV